MTVSPRHAATNGVTSLSHSIIRISTRPRFKTRFLIRAMALLVPIAVTFAVLLNFESDLMLARGWTLRTIIGYVLLFATLAIAFRAGRPDQPQISLNADRLRSRKSGAMEAYLADVLCTGSDATRDSLMRDAGRTLAADERAPLTLLIDTPDFDAVEPFDSPKPAVQINDVNRPWGAGVIQAARSNVSTRAQRAGALNRYLRDDLWAAVLFFVGVFISVIFMFRGTAVTALMWAMPMAAIGQAVFGRVMDRMTDDWSGRLFAAPGLMFVRSAAPLAESFKLERYPAARSVICVVKRPMGYHLILSARDSESGRTRTTRLAATRREVEYVLRCAWSGVPAPEVELSDFK
jgi:hypothetical protein